MPWLTSVALLHSALVTEKRDTLKNWTILLAIIAFSFSLIGTFIVRSGILTSVHSFANDPTRGVWLLFMISLIVGLALVLFSLRASELSKNVTFSLISRESALISNNLLLMVSTVVVFIGTLWPLLIETLIGEKISVGAPFFNKAFTPFMVLLAMILPLGAVLPWRKSFNSNYLIVLLPIFVFSIFVGIIVYEMQQKNNLIAPIGIVLSVWVIFGAWSEFFVKNRIFSTNYSLALYRILHMRASDWGKIIAHSGFGIIIFGISSITAWEIEDIRVVKIGDTYSAGSYKFTLNNVINKNGPNYVSTMGLLDVLDKNNNFITTLKPEKRFFPTQSITTTEAAIDNGLTRDIYVVLGSEQNKSEWVIRTYIKPFVNWIWLGAFILSLGGILSIVDKKLRIGIASRKEHLI
jgi:cytochrome c-type biogenesis protein CcmF